MSDRILMRLSGNLILSNSWKQELIITEIAVHGEVIRKRVPWNLKRIKMTLPFDRIAQVNIIRGLLTAELEIVNKGGADNLVIEGLNKNDAERAKKLIEERIRLDHASIGAVANTPTMAEEIQKLSELKNTGLLTEAEFEAGKKKLLGM
jgi:Short C-terminal domain